MGEPEDEVEAELDPELGEAADAAERGVRRYRAARDRGLQRLLQSPGDDEEEPT